MPEQPESTSDSESSQTSGLSKKSILLAAVIGLVMLFLSLIGYALMSESGVPSEEEPPFFEEPLDRSNAAEENPEIDNEVEEEFCTLDAKICPDGTTVGRVVPSCEFAPCPGE